MKKKKIIEQSKKDRVSQNELNYYRSEMSRKNESEKQMKTEIGQLEKEINSLQARLKCFEKDKLENQNYARRICELENENYSLQKELSNKKQEISDNQKKISELQEGNDYFKKELCNRKQENCDNLRNLSELQEQNFGLKKDLSKKNQEICDHQRKLFKIEEENFQLKKQLTKKSKFELQNRISELESDVMSLKYELSKRNDQKTSFSACAPIFKCDCQCKGKSHQKRNDFSTQFNDSSSESLSEHLRILGQEIKGLKKNNFLNSEAWN